MADKELVIKIPEELYEQCKETELTEENEGFNFHIINTVANGTPLPKGHGELIDRSKLSICPIDITDLPQDKCLMVYLADDVDNAEVIIEPDNYDKTCVNCFHNYGVRHNFEFNPEDIVCEYWESDGLTKDDFCSRWKDKESEG